VTLLTRAADKMIELMVPRATVSATDTINLYCGCIGGYKWYKRCQILNGDQLDCGGCNIKSSTKC
jgi:hypothetical protein